MLRAIEAMRASIAEPRGDGKVSPRVGAALLKPNGEIQTASRGQLRMGDHAEFTLLERMNRAEALDGCRLFATLEPCAPGARNAPKLSCAERIVLARIPEVWIGVDDLDPEALREFGSAIGVNADVRSEPFVRRLLAVGLVRRDDERLAPSGYGLLLFGREPRAWIREAGLLATAFGPDGSEQTRDFDGPAVLVPRVVQRWLRDRLGDPIARHGARRTRLNEALFEVVREAVANALLHRDYGVVGAKCQLVVTEDSVAVKSPGRPVAPITMAQLAGFDAPTLSRNPIMHYVFSRMGLAEERGLGLRSMRRSARDAQLPLPTCRWEEPYVVLAVHRTAQAAAPAGAGRATRWSVTDAATGQGRGSARRWVRKAAANPAAMAVFRGGGSGGRGNPAMNPAIVAGKGVVRL